MIEIRRLGDPATMAVIHGSGVDLVCPFPLDQLKLVYQWLHAHPTLTEHDDSPGSAEHYELLMSLQLSVCTSYGLLRAGTTSGLIGMLHFEPSGTRNGYLHIAMSHSAWGRGLADEAAALCIQELFEKQPALTRLSAAMLERNRAAQSLARRMGFTLEATLADMVLQQGTPRSILHYGLTRRDWERLRGEKSA